MSYVLERDGLAACPDDPLRVSGPEGWTAEEERRYDREWSERHAMHLARLLSEVRSTIAGARRLVDIEGQVLDRADLFEAITADEEYDRLAPLLLGDGCLGTALIQKFCDERATHAANRDMEGWQP